MPGLKRLMVLELPPGNRSSMGLVPVWAVMMDCILSRSAK